MSTAYVGPGWENPERKKIFGGSIADVYIRDGFTVAVLDTVSYIDQQAGRSVCDVAIYLPNDASRSTAHTWLRSLEDAEQFITRYRADHPDLPTEPVPLTVYVKDFKVGQDARAHVVQIAEVLEAGDYDFHGESVWMSALLLLLHCPRYAINQKSIDRAWALNAVFNELKD